MINERLFTIIALVMAINEKTKHAAFFNISGHVETMSIDVRESKEAYPTILFEERYIELNGPRAVKISKLDYIIEELSRFLK